MSEEIRKLFYHIQIELSWLERHLYSYKKIYMKSVDNLKACNDISPDFFAYLQLLLIDNIILSISRMTDVAISGSNENASLDNLCNRVVHYYKDQLDDERNNKFQDLKLKLENNLIKIKDSTKAIREHRNKRISHLDFKKTLDEDFTDVTYKEFADLKKMIFELVNEVSVFIDNKYLSEISMPPPGGIDSLIQAIKYASQLKEQDKRKYFLDFTNKLHSHRHSKPLGREEYLKKMFERVV